MASAHDDARELRRRGLSGADVQAPRRGAEAAVRRHTCVVARCLDRAGVDVAEIAARLGVATDTLAAWRDDVVRRPQPKPLGARPMECLPAVARRVRHQLAVYGPGIGPRTLKPEFPDVSWRDLGRIVHGFRASLADCLHSCVYRACLWNVPGMVWAIDYSEPDAPIDGRYRYLLDVRDLGTGYVVASMPCERDDAETTVACLSGLFHAFGAPLVLKADNGSHFTAQLVRDLVDEHGVSLLLSPVYMPQFNGACEAGHGAIKTRAEALARRDGTPGQWTANHIEAARTWVNRLMPEGGGLTPQQRWQGRQPISDHVRQQFIDTVEADVIRRRREVADALERGARRNSIPRDALARHAIVATLIGAGYLELRSRPIRQPIPWLSRRSITL